MRRSCLRTGVTGKRTGAGIPGSGIHVTHEPYQKLLRYLGDPGVMGIFKKTLKTTLEKRMNLHRSLRIHEYHTPYDAYPHQGLFGGTAGRRVFYFFFTKTAAGVSHQGRRRSSHLGRMNFSFRIAKISVSKRKWSIPR